MKLVLEQVLTVDPQAAVVGTAGQAPANGRGPEPGSQGPSLPAATPPAGAGSGSAGGSGASRLVGRVVDELERPVAGATVLFAAGGTGTTGADGDYELAGAPGGACFVSAPGFVTSVVVAGNVPDVLHLRHLEPGATPFDSQDVVIRGSVSWPEAPHQGGAVYYRDDHGSLSDPVVVDPEGLFALRIRTQRSGAPRGVVLALAAGPDDTPMMGLSHPFSLFDQGAAPIEVPIVLAERTISFAVGTPPAGLPELRSRLEITPPGMSPFHLDGEGVTSGQFQVPAAGALPATMRIAVEAFLDDQARSVVAMDPYAMPATPPDFMALPTLSVDAATRTIGWSGAEDARGVLLQLRQAPRLAEAYWEGWLEGRSERVFEPPHWPTGASAIAQLTAVDGQEANARQVAAARSLRLLPFERFQRGYRLAESQLTFAP